MKTAKHPNDEADLPEEDSKPPAKRPRRKAAIKSEKLIAGMAEDDDDVKNSPPKRPRRKKAALKSEEPAKDDSSSAEHGGSGPVVINVDAMVNVMEFLPPRSLYDIALTCKSLREMVTTKMVVHSALIHGGHAKKTMEELYNMMKNRSIHVPSPLRLLRLANGKRCEFCVNKSVNSLYNGLNIGAFSCWDCLAKGDDPLTKAWKTSWARYWRNPVYQKILNHPRVAFRDKSKGKFLWIQDRMDAHGEKFGPIVCWEDIDAMAECADGKNATAAAKAASSVAANHASVAANYVAGRLAEANALSNIEWIDRYLTDTLGAPPVEEYSEFIEAFADITDRARRIAREKENIKRDKRVKKQENRRAATDKFLADVTALIDEPFREKAVESSSSSYKTFVTPFVEDLMGPYLRAVSSIKKNTSTELAKEINTFLRSLDELLAMNFLSDDDAFESAAKAFFVESFPNMDAVFNARSYYSSNRLDSNFRGFMKENCFFKALCYLKEYDLSPMILATEPSASLAKASNYLNESSLKRVAQRAWKKHFDFLKTEESFDSAKNTRGFQETHNYFGQVLAKLDEYSTWLDAKREAAKSEEELRVWQNRSDRAMLQDVANGYDSRSFSYFMAHDFELMFKYQTDSSFRYEQMRLGWAQEG